MRVRIRHFVRWFSGSLVLHFWMNCRHAGERYGAKMFTECTSGWEGWGQVVACPAVQVGLVAHLDPVAQGGHRAMGVPEVRARQFIYLGGIRVPRMMCGGMANLPIMVRVSTATVPSTVVIFAVLVSGQVGGIGFSIKDIKVSNHLISFIATPAFTGFICNTSVAINIALLDRRGPCLSGNGGLVSHLTTHQSVFRHPVHLASMDTTSPLISCAHSA